ncbi:hypothetical protein [Virgibacillus sp. YIM 98842]|uniref:hypothetical protein n=1 Tax=Virgibacillus sp. YIM 98842 TaxID=2663533 RepID=UPI0013DB71BA|nr:hypothetical protein [Virgibacillus sp. YIM 98842]
MNNNHKFLTVVFTLLIVTLTACGNSPEEPSADSDSNSANSSAKQNTNDNSSEQGDTQDSSSEDQATESNASRDTYSEQEEENQDSQYEEQSKEEPLEEYVPGEDDVVVSNTELKNKDILEDFMEIAGENGENNESEIKVVKDEGEKGVRIYELKSRYDENADQAWIDVFPDLSYYRASEDEVQDVFNNARQQCGYMEKDEFQGFYKLYECRTHWEYHFIPIDHANE